MEAISSAFDVAVIGSGIAGLAAALTVAEGGAKAIIFEKQRSLGGTSNFFEGTFAVESSMQRAKYITYSRDEAFKYIMGYSHWKVNPRLVRTIINESAVTISWLQKQGVEFSDVTINMPDSPQTYHVVKGKGETAVKILVSRARNLGVEIRSATPVTRILRTGETITGIIVDENGEERRIQARAVIIASGGYLNNKEWIKKYAGFDLGINLFPVGNVGKNGDGIRMAWEVGAAEEGIGCLELYRVGPLGDEFAMGCQIEFAATQPDLWINSRGERFCDESIAFYDSEVGNANARYKEGYTFSIFDDSIIQRMLEKGVDKNVGIANPPGSKPVALEQEMKAALARNSSEVFEADSVEELARKIGVDPAVLKATVDEYNYFCAKGHDDLFAKDSRYLWALKGPKYYAVRARTVCLGTMGGIKINEKAEVIDKKGNPVPGLYAAGFDAGGMFADSYPIKGASGLASAFALNSGRIAGKNALKYLGK